MTGGLMQLVAYGAQDIYLTGNPVITFFKTIYRRHTNFAMDSIMQTFTSPVDFGSTVTTLIDRSGDLLTGIYLETTLPDLDIGESNHIRWIDNLGHYLIKDIYITIGGQKIDQQCGDWLEIWTQLTVPYGKMIGYREMIGQDPRNFLGMNTGLQRDSGSGKITGKTIYVPLKFWFCKNPGLALPMIALQYSEVKVHMTLRKLDELVITDGNLLSGNLTNTNLWADYIYLDTEERRRFAQISHEYLIEQVQKVETTVPGHINSIDIDLNELHHPIKELIWVSRSAAALENGNNQWSNYTTTPAIRHINNSLGIGDLTNLGEVNQLDSIINNIENTNILALTSHSHTRPIGSTNPTFAATLYLNGNKRFSKRLGLYFNWIQCKNHHSNIPLSPGINVYSFSYSAEQYQPSGTCNFSRLISSKLSIEFNQGRNLYNGIQFKNSARHIQVFAVNYNILKVMSGMAGISYTD